MKNNNQTCDYKLIFTGATGAGKTTAIAALSEIPAVSTDVASTDAKLINKSITTVALDYGEITLAGGEKLRIYGTPGQERFDFMWKILGDGALGVVILIDHSRPDALGDLLTYFNAFKDLVRNARAVVGVGRTGSQNIEALDPYNKLAQSMRISIPILSVDVRQRDDVLLLLNILFFQMEGAEIKIKNQSRELINDR